MLSGAHQRREFSVFGFVFSGRRCSPSRRGPKQPGVGKFQE
jgi:hypothetical protein